MEDIDATQLKLKSLEAELKTRRATAVSVQTEVESARPGLQSAIDEMKTQIADAEAIPPGEGLSAYRRLRTANGSGCACGNRG